MPYDFTAAMRSAVLRGGKPMQDFVAFLYDDDRTRAKRLGRTDRDGFRVQHAKARHALCQPHGLAAPAINWTTAGALICDTAQALLRQTPKIDPEAALRQIVHGVNAGTIKPTLNRGGHLRLG